jgi:DHA1 family bicyclomycin/chloramphenicol resistance-like MFS transporter
MHMLRLGEKAVFILIVMLSIFGPLSTDMYLSGLPEMIDYFGTNETVISITLYGFMVFMALGCLVLGPISDKYGRRPVLIFSMAVYIFGSIGCCLTSNIWVMILFRIIQAVGGGGAIALSVALIKDYFVGDKLGKALSLTAVIGVLGPILAPIIGTILIETVDWQATFWAPALVSSICLIMAFMLPGDIPTEKFSGSVAGSLKSMFGIFGNRDFFSFMVLVCIFILPFMAYLAVSSYIYQDMFGVSAGAYSLFLAASMIIGIVCMTVFQKFIGRLGNRVTLWILLCIGAMDTILIPTVGSINEYLFMLSMVPAIFLITTFRSFGYNILLNQRDYSSGSVSSVLNFTTFMLGFVGMMIGSMPWGNFIYGITFCAGISSVIFFAIWAYTVKKGTTVRGIDGVSRDS